MDNSTTFPLPQTSIHRPDQHGVLLPEMRGSFFAILSMLLEWCYTVAMERNEQIVSSNTRYPKDLHDALQHLAREHRRSFNAEVMWALQRYVRQEHADNDGTGETGPPLAASPPWSRE